jgi:hypothetical protein
MKSEDATMVYILDTSKSDFSINGGLISTYWISVRCTGKIKYPGDSNQGPSSPTSARHPEITNNGSSPSPTRGLQNEATSPTTGYHPSNLAHQRQSTMPPRSESPITNHNAAMPDNRPPQQGRGNQLAVHPPNPSPGPNVSWISIWEQISLWNTHILCFW